VLPRAARIPGLKDTRTASEHLRYSSKLSKWLEDGHLIKDGSGTNWKQQYRLRHNWCQGQCAVSEIVVAERPPDPPLLVIMSNSTIFTADSMSGMRAWSTRAERELLASTPLLDTTSNTARLPTSMAIDAHTKGHGFERVVVGFEDGSFTIYELRKAANAFKPLFEHPPSTNGMLSAIAYSMPYLLTMTEHQLLSVYVFTDGEHTDGALQAPQLLYSLRSHTVWPPVSLSIRSTSTSMTAAIAYTLPTYLSGWTVGIQEMRISHSGELLESRLTTAADDHSHTLSGERSSSSPTTRRSSLHGTSQTPVPRESPSNSKPTSLSYSHPYLLAAHPDNTLSLYLVHSTSSSLSIGSGTRLWGHTSSVSGAHVGIRGKAVSVSRLGDELRVWDLEGGMSSSANKRRSRAGELSVRVQPGKGSDIPSDPTEEDLEDEIGLRHALDQGFDDVTVSRGWVGFDEHSVIVLKEKSEGSQALVVYDFT
jgi:hypothetical protein